MYCLKRSRKFEFRCDSWFLAPSALCSEKCREHIRKYGANRIDYAACVVQATRKSNRSSYQRMFESDLNIGRVSKHDPKQTTTSTLTKLKHTSNKNDQESLQKHTNVPTKMIQKWPNLWRTPSAEAVRNDMAHHGRPDRQCPRHRSQQPSGCL